MLQELFEGSPAGRVGGADSEAVGSKLLGVPIDNMLDRLPSVGVDSAAVRGGGHRANEAAERNAASRTRLLGFSYPDSSSWVPTQGIGNDSALEIVQDAAYEPLALGKFALHVASPASHESSGPPGLRAFAARPERVTAVWEPGVQLEVATDAQ